MKNERAEWMWRISDEDIYLRLAKKQLLCVFFFVADNLEKTLLCKFLFSWAKFFKLDTYIC